MRLQYEWRVPDAGYRLYTTCERNEPENAGVNELVNEQIARQRARKNQCPSLALALPFDPMKLLGMQSAFSHPRRFD